MGHGFQRNQGTEVHLSPKEVLLFLDKVKGGTLAYAWNLVFMFLFFKNSLDILFQKLFSLFLACYLQNYCDFLVYLRKND